MFIQRLWGIGVDERAGDVRNIPELIFHCIEYSSGVGAVERFRENFFHEQLIVSQIDCPRKEEEWKGIILVSWLIFHERLLND